jgi:hypothetical protein
MQTSFGRFWLIAVSFLISGKALAQNSPFALSVVAGHVYVVRGASIRNGDYLSVEPSGLFFFGPIGPPLALVARPMLGIGGSGAGIGLALSLAPALTAVDSRGLDDDFFIGPFASLEAHVERMYGPTSWRSAIYAGPQLSLSLFVLKASLGWMVDVGDHRDRHVQVALGAGF